MKATIVSTNKTIIVKDLMGQPAMARVWEGTSEGGVKFVAYIGSIDIVDGDKTIASREIRENVPPQPDTVRQIETKMVRT